MEPVLVRAEALAARGATDDAVALLQDFAGRLVRAQRTPAAVAPLELAVRLAPERGDLHLFLARVLGELTRFHDALASLERAMELGESRLDVRLLHAGAYWEIQDYETAEQLYRRAVELHSDVLAPRSQLGGFLLWRGRATEAVEVLARAAELADDSTAAEKAEVLFLLARALAESGETESAVATYERLLRLHPRHARGRYLLGLLRQRRDAVRRDAVRRDAVRRDASTSGTQSPGDGVVLTPVTERAGIAFHHDGGLSPQRHMPETMGSGLAWLDYDGDGRWDLYLVQSGPWPASTSEEETARPSNRLYRNLGDGTFEDVTVRAGAGETSYGQGVVAADIDGDGDSDLYLTNYGPDVLLENLGDGTFADRTADLGLGLDGWSSSAALADAEGDGDLDLYVARYLEYDPAHGRFCGDRATEEREYCNVQMFPGVDDRFYRQRDDGTFLDATSEAGLAAGGRGLGVVWTDLDDDGRSDLYVANDLTPNVLYKNRGDGTFEDVSLFSGAAYNREGKREAGMGVAAGDVDGDGLPELLVSNFDVETNTLYTNRGDLFFDDATVESGFGLPSVHRLGFGLVLADFDSDGDLDAYVANGHVFARPKRDGVERAQDDLLLLGDGHGHFLQQPLLSLSGPRVGRGAAVADYDSDGDVDLAVQNNTGPALLLRNDGIAKDGAAGRWLGVELHGRRRNSEAVGARVTLKTGRPGGALRRQVRWVMAGQSYQSSADRRQLFGWPAAEKLHELEVAWPSGCVTRVSASPERRYLHLREPDCS